VCHARRQYDKEGWPAARFLAALAEHAIADRGRRRIECHLAEARLPVGKTLDSFDFDAVPMVSKAQVMALTAGDSWLEKGANLLLFGPPESDSYCPSHYVPIVPVLFAADRQMPDGAVAGLAPPA
jgi:DNA replication protein DnaC